MRRSSPASFPVSSRRLDRAIWPLRTKALAKLDGPPDQVRAGRMHSCHHLRPRLRAPAALTSGLLLSFAPDEEGAGNAGCTDAPAALRAKSESTQASHHRSPVDPAFPARWFYGFLRALPGDRAFLSPSQAAMRQHCRPLDASVEASGPHDFAVRFECASSCASTASTASRAQRS